MAHASETSGQANLKELIKPSLPDNRDNLTVSGARDVTAAHRGSLEIT